ncbi:MAG: alpha amylase C-terminal domain-containing protein, partial [Puniceicoccales bacterium]|nr:alpha amylase C-terminal domain-containing protein [Puniceicoccales bacterium]
NFTPIPRDDYAVGVPLGGFWEEVLNGDATAYGGTGSGNCGGKTGEPIPCNGFHYRLRLHLPPHCTLILRPKITP